MLLFTLIAEFLISSYAGKKIRQYLPSKQHENNKENIDRMHDMPVFTNVGELREILSNFSDDTPTQYSFYEVPHVQVRVVDGNGHICFGQTHYTGQPYDGTERKFTN